ncbi:type II secretion system F family protein [Lederbergia sp. NSJ-179]|uniref:type II secretion system F family protein n=1 Tax=Lederbergia sp. NSJ-179 TaxID=2931402 RepID=UPI001FD21D32|nr:type II secretion system F family protein [Lederbergia sp. NSJ-179]MCJ7840227.1 type II secretion system F family protein [Lederbergia sp. NSJ-179]
MVIYGILLAVLLVMMLILYIASRHKYDETIEEFEGVYPLLFLAPVSLLLMNKLKILERMHTQVAYIQQKMISLHGSRDALKHTRMFLAQLISVIFLCLLGACLLGLLTSGDHLLFGIGLMFTVMIPTFLINQLSTLEKERKHKILLELPEFVNKVILLVNAGETVQQAIIRCVEMNTNDDSPLYKELKETVNRMTSNEPFPQALNELSKQCAIQEVAIFTTTVLLNYRKGGQDLILSLRELSHDLWEKRKNISRTKGEEASSKLVFPLIIIFVAIMIIVGYPAISIM